MLKKNTREILFFIVVFILIYFALMIEKWFGGSLKMPNSLRHMLLSVAVVLLSVGVYYLAHLNSDTENFWDVSPAALCKGGPYMWQGDSATAEMCRKMADSEEGRCAISSYNCPTGFVGTPKIPFYYSALSGDSWENTRCSHEASCNCSGKCLDSFERQVPFDTNTQD